MGDKKKRDTSLIMISLILIFSVVIVLTKYPQKGTAFADTTFVLLTKIFGSGILIFTFFSVLFLIFLAFSKYGNISMGNCKPEYSTYSWVAMMLCAGCGSATIYWAFLEWAYYYMAPPFGIESETYLAYEWATTYNLFHWGISGWSLFCIASLPIAYHFHVRNREGLSLSAVVAESVSFGSNPIVRKIVDITFIFAVFGGLSICLALSTPLIGEGVSRIFKITHSFSLDMLIILIISAIYSFSSYIGIEKGMRKLSDFATYFAIIFAGIILFVGPTSFIIKSTTNAIGLMMQNFIHMSLWTDPINNSGFPEEWTVFYWLYWIAYTPFMGLFIAKVSKGRKIKEIIWNMLISGSAGCWIFFGVLGNFSMYSQLEGAVPVSKMLLESGGSFVVMELMEQLPFPNLMLAIFSSLAVLLLATTLDSASYTLAATATPSLSNKEDPSPMQRLFWCIMVSLVPLTLMFIGAPLNAIKTCGVITALPLTFILIVIIGGFIRWLREDWGEGFKELKDRESAIIIENLGNDAPKNERTNYQRNPNKLELSFK